MRQLRVRPIEQWLVETQLCKLRYCTWNRFIVCGTWKAKKRWKANDGSPTEQWCALFVRPRRHDDNAPKRGSISDMVFFFKSFAAGKNYVSRSCSKSAVLLVTSRADLPTGVAPTMASTASGETAVPFSGQTALIVRYRQ